MKNNKRSLFILKYLIEQSDESHLVTIASINEYLRQHDLDANRETISDCIKELQEVGYDIFCVRSTQNQYYMRERTFSLAEVKLLVDAIQSSRFIPEEQSIELISKLADLVGSHKGEILKRHILSIGIKMSPVQLAPPRFPSTTAPPCFFYPYYSTLSV